MPYTNIDPEISDVQRSAVFTAIATELGERFAQSFPPPDPHPEIRSPLAGRG